MMHKAKRVTARTRWAPPQHSSTSCASSHWPQGPDAAEPLSAWQRARCPEWAGSDRTSSPRRRTVATATVSAWTAPRRDAPTHRPSWTWAPPEPPARRSSQHDERPQSPDVTSLIVYPTRRSTPSADARPLLDHHRPAPATNG